MRYFHAFRPFLRNVAALRWRGNRRYGSILRLKLQQAAELRRGLLITIRVLSPGRFEFIASLNVVLLNPIKLQL